MKTYIDFDGVVFDTETLLFDKNYYEAKKLPGFDKQAYVRDLDWYELITRSKKINEAIKILKELKQSIILTKVNSLYNKIKEEFFPLFIL